MWLFAVALLYGSGVGADIVNPSFEEAGVGWTGLVREAAENFAAPHGSAFASLAGGATISQNVGVVEAGVTYRVTAYARSVNERGTSATSLGRVALGPAVATAALDPVAPHGDARDYGNDDGGNVWFDGAYRLQAAEVIMYQDADEDPAVDDWRASVELPEIANYAPGPIVTPKGLRALYGMGGSCAAPGTAACDACIEACDDCEAEGSCADEADDLPPGCACKSAIIPVWLTGEPPFYGFQQQAPVLEHSSMLAENKFTNFFPSPIDAHLFHDGDTGRLWMAWGGWTIFVTELDAETGRMLGDPADVEVDRCIDATPSCATPILSFADSAKTGGAGPVPDGWAGDALSAASYVEGPALFKHGGFWYALASYGDLAKDYTIRVCRNAANAPNEGAFTDKEGLPCLIYDAARGRYGCSMLLGSEGVQAVPGHPHVWREADGRFFLGYDFRDSRDGVQGEMDYFGIRALHWVDGWPTIWTPMTATFLAAADDPLVGQPLQVALSSVGNGTVAFDHVVLSKESADELKEGDGGGFQKSKNKKKQKNKQKGKKGKKSKKSKKKGQKKKKKNKAKKAKGKKD